MPQPPAPPAPPANPKKRKQQMIIAGVALAGLLFLFMRSRRGSGGSSSVDPQKAAADAAAQQAQLDQGAQATAGGVTPSTFADNGAQAAALGDAVTQGLSGVSNALQSLQQQAPTGEGGMGAPAAASPMTTVTINGTGVGQPAGSPAAATSGAARPSKPANPAGGGHYTWSGSKWQLVHAVGHNKWAAGPPPRPKLKPKAPNGHRRRRR